MKKALILFAHPNPSRSRANIRILAALRSLSMVTVHDLYEEYPYFHIDVEREKSLLLKHDLIFFQHPFYWYNMPPLLKKWMDEVLEMGFAYGEGGDKLKGKAFLSSITAGGPEESYQSGGYNQYKVEEFLLPQKASAQLCGMFWLPPKIFHKAIRAGDDEIEAYAQTIKKEVEKYLEKGWH